MEGRSVHRPTPAALLERTLGCQACITAGSSHTRGVGWVPAGEECECSPSGATAGSAAGKARRSSTLRTAALSAVGCWRHHRTQLRSGQSPASLPACCRAAVGTLLLKASMRASRADERGSGGARCSPPRSRAGSSARRWCPSLAATAAPSSAQSCRCAQQRSSCRCSCRLTGRSSWPVRAGVPAP